MFLELSERELAELFGNRPYKEDHEELQDGIFPEEMVEKASWECMRTHQTYDELHLWPREADRYADMYVESWRELGGGIVQVKLGDGKRI